MASNKHTVSDRSSLLRSKLSALAKKLQGGIESSSFQTKEEYLLESIRLLRSFYKDLKGPLLLPDIAHADILPDKEDFNDLWESLLDDLQIIFSELENIESLVLSNFNFITTESNRLRTRLKSVSSKTGDFILYSVNPLKDVLFFKDSFSDLTKVDSNNSLLNLSQCEVNQDEGIVTLPIDLDANSSVSITTKPIINSNSNGVVGNNQQIDSPFNGDLSVIIDNNPDTWFEYERVESRISENTEALRLDLTINLGDVKAVNNIVVNPNNFGTRIALKILSIDTSFDGVVYTSIKDDIPISGFTAEDEENIFSLAPATSKFAGQGIYTFTPRKIKYIRLVLEQDEPYIIQTATGEKLRYAIGIRDIEINSYQYKEAGELISKSFTLSESIRKILLDTVQNPSDFSELVSVKWYISPDDGMKWIEIQPKKFGALSGIQSTVPEILNFNSIDENAISTESPVRSVRVKMLLERNSDAFTEGSSTLKKEIINQNELKIVPTAEPFTLNLDHPPVDGTVSVINPLYGSRGLPETPYIIASKANGQQLFRLPKQFIDLAWPLKKIWLSGESRWYTWPVAASDWLHIEVAGEEWSHSSTPISDLTSGGKVFTYSQTTGELIFGNGTTATQPPDSASIVLHFDEERIFPNTGEDNHVAKLVFATSNNKSGVTIGRKDDLKVVSEIIPKNVTIVKLTGDNITTRGVTLITAVLESSDSGMAFTTQATYINGREEIVSANHWSIDTKNGILYLGHPTPSDREATIEYEYQPSYTLTEDDWDFVSNDSIRQKVSIKDSAWLTRIVKDETLPTIQNLVVLDLEHLSVVEGTLRLSATINGAAVDSDKEPFFKEAKFIDGVTELGLRALKKAMESVPSLVPGSSDIATFTLKETISTDAKNRVSFLKAVLFKIERSSLGTVVSIGDYFIDRSTGVVSVKLPSDSTITDPDETIIYWYPEANRSTDGIYSVNYANGMIYLQRPINPDNVSGYAVTANYEYTNYSAKYRIARRLEEKDFDVDITDSQVTVSEREILSNILIPRADTSAIRPYYIVNYDSVIETRESVEDLERLFSPIIKDYILKVIPESRII